MQASHQPTSERTQRLVGPIPAMPGDTTPLFPGFMALENLAATVSVRKDGEIYAQGGSARHCYRIVSGCVRTVKLMEDGRRQVNDFLLPGDWFGFDAFGEHDSSAEAVSPVVLRRYPRRGFELLAEREPGVARWLFDLTSRQLRNARDRMLTLGRRTASERIAGFLLEIAQRMPQDRTGAVALPMSRGDIADHLGLTIETVCRSLAQLRRDGTIALTRNSFTVCNRPALQALASAVRH
jgi:CRP/FNR family nitrogen fixation transcriptional regulator